jgi:hypothetical protein
LGKCLEKAGVGVEERVNKSQGPHPPQYHSRVELELLEVEGQEISIAQIQELPAIIQIVLVLFILYIVLILSSDTDFSSDTTLMTPNKI